MENPCKTCLLVNNCTAVCEAKENFQTLLKNAIKSHGVWNWVNKIKDNHPQYKLYRKWLRYKTENDSDIAAITGRASRLKSGLDNI